MTDTLTHMNPTHNTADYIQEIMEVVNTAAATMPGEHTPQETLDHISTAYTTLGYAAQHDEEVYAEMSAQQRESSILAGMVAEGLLNGNITDPELGNTRTYALNLTRNLNIFTQ